MTWHKRAICPKCGWHCEALFGDLFRVHIECCPRCGQEKESPNRLSGNKFWKIETMRWVAKPKLFDWFAGEWEIKE
jgi:ribosomal protein S27AE